jgi:hypothetical protein
MGEYAADFKGNAIREGLVEKAGQNTSAWCFVESRVESQGLQQASAVVRADQLIEDLLVLFGH